MLSFRQLEFIVSCWDFGYSLPGTDNFSPSLLPACSTVSHSHSTLKISSYVLCWGSSSLHERSSSSSRKQPSPVTSLQDSPISHSHLSAEIQPLCEMQGFGHLSIPLSSFFVVFYFLLRRWIPAGSQCKSFWSWFTMEHEGIPLEQHSGLKVLLVQGRLRGSSQAGQDYTSRKVWLTQFPHWLSTRNALVNTAPQRSEGWDAGCRVQLVYVWAAQIRGFSPLMSALLSALAHWVCEISLRAL